jgi:hypothetical protein
MVELPVPHVMITEDQRDAYLESGYNVPAADYDRKEFSSERWRVFQAVKAAVSVRWTPGIQDGDFFMPECFERNRMLCVEVGNERMLDKRLLKDIHDTISRFEPRYSVDVCDAWGFLKTPDGQSCPHFNIFVEKDRILICTQSDIVLRTLGLCAEGRRGG